MLKIGILTINDNYNYGNRLQNYATQEFLKEMNIIAETIKNENNRYIEKFKRLVRFFIKHKKYKREKNFIKFNNQYIIFSKYLINYKLKKIRFKNKYDFFITGSDQVWNPTFGRMSDIDFLTFVESKKRISFAASFGISEIPKDMEEYYKERLNKFKALSVREERGKEIIKELTNRDDAVVILDPTMLIPIEKWEQVMEKPTMLKKLKGKKYILNYFLGNLSESRKKEIKRVATENNCEIINILDKNDPFYTCGPGEFLYLEKNAFLICTDSFHSSVFAILFNRPLVIFDREDKEVKMNSRLETLMKKFGLENRWFKDKIDSNLLKSNYQIEDILNKERKKASKFINEAIK